MKLLPASTALLICLAMASQSFGAPLSLQECLQKARDNNPTLKSALWDKGIAEENGRLASASLLPRVDATAGYSMMRAPQAVKMGGVTAETQEPDFAFAGLAATYTVYDFGRRTARIQQTKASTEAAEHSYLSGKSDLTLHVIEAYFRLLETERLLQAAHEEIAQITEHHRVARILFEEGVVTRNDVLQAEVRLASAKQKLLALTNKRDNGWLLLNFLTGAAPEFRGELDMHTSLNSPATLESQNAAIPDKRHDLRVQKLLFDAREYEVQEHKDNYLPEIFARVGMDYVQNSKVREQALYSATLGIRINLFDGYSADAAREKAIKLRSKQQDTLRLTEQQAMLEISTARNDSNTARKRISVTETAIRHSEENLRINKERYQERVGTASEVLDAQTLVIQAKTEYYRAQYDLQTATARLQNALGEL